LRRPAFALLCAVLLAPGRTRGADAISWEEADKHVGETTAVDGRVMGIHCSPTSCLLAFDPTFNRFTAVVQAASFKDFPPESLDQKYTGRKVRVHGTIVSIDKKPEIVLAKPDDIELTEPEAEEKAAADQPNPQAEIVDRLDAIIDRLDELTQRFVDAQSRLEQLALVLDERAAQMAQTLQPPPAPPPPSYGEPQPRPAYEALRTIKRGMTADQVARLIGQPLAVAPDANGGGIWDYGGGRMITFDPRGHVTAFSGFPPP
jgi:hypothetical protein